MSVLRGGQSARQRCSLGDFVPIVLDSAVPKPSSECLVRGSGRAAGDSQEFHLVEGIAVPVAGQPWGAARTKLARALQGKRGNPRPGRELGLLWEIRRG